MTKLSLRIADDFSLPHQSLKRNVLLVKPPGEGKSHTILSMIIPLIQAGAGMVILDASGRIYTELQSWVAHYADVFWETLPTGWTDDEKRKATKLHVFDRFTFAYLGSAHPSIHRMNPLARMKKQDGTLETVQESQAGMKKLYDVLFQRDIGNRQTFMESFRNVTTALIAGNRTMDEAHDLIMVPDYWNFLLGEIEKTGVLSGPDKWFVSERLKDLRLHLDSRFRSGGKGNPPMEVPPYGMLFQNQFGSTARAVQPFGFDTDIGNFFSAQTFDASRIAFGNGVLIVSTDASSTTDRVPFFATVYSFAERMYRMRVPKAGHTYKRSYLVCDDFATWASPAITDYMSTSRNNNIAWIAAYQDPEQFRTRGMEGLENELEGLCAVRMYGPMKDPARAERLARQITKASPMGRVLPYDTTSENESRTDGVSETEGEADVYTDTHSTSTSRSSSSRAGAGMSLQRVDLGDGFSMMEPTHSTNDSYGGDDSDGDSSGASAARGTNRSRGTSTQRAKGNATNHQLHIVSTREQVENETNSILQMDRFETIIVYNLKRKAMVWRGALREFRPYESERKGKRVLKNYIDAAPHYRRKDKRTAYHRTLFMEGRITRSERRKAQRAIDFTKKVDQMVGG